MANYCLKELLSFPSLFEATDGAAATQTPAVRDWDRFFDAVYPYLVRSHPSVRPICTASFSSVLANASMAPVASTHHRLRKWRQCAFALACLCISASFLNFILLTERKMASHGASDRDESSSEVLKHALWCSSSNGGEKVQMFMAAIDAAYQ